MGTPDTSNNDNQPTLTDPNKPTNQLPIPLRTLKTNQIHHQNPTMKIFAIGICRPNTEGMAQGETKEDEPIIISQVFDVAEFNFFQRSSVRQFLTAFTRIF